MRRNLWVALLLALATTGASAQWQQSVTPQIALGIREKNGERDYVAEFIVVDPKGKSSSQRIKVPADEFASVIFPADFNTYLGEPGIYRWIGRVAGKQVIGGQFRFERTNGGTRLTVLD